MQIIVINLRSATARLQFMTEQLGSNFHRIEAVLGRDVPPRLAPQFSRSTRLGAGEVGCYASHLLAAEHIMRNNLPYAVVLEDDVNLDADFLDAVRQGVASLSSWDLISLSGAKQFPHLPIRQLGQRRLVRYLHFPKTTAAYILSNSGSKKLLAPKHRERPIDVDLHYGWEMGIDGFGIYPPLAKQSGLFDSSIPKSARRVYWRSNPIGYAMGRFSNVRRVGLMNALRAIAAR